MSTSSSSLAVIIPAAGRSTRFSQLPPGVASSLLHPAMKKPFLDLEGQPVWYRAIVPFLQRSDLVQIVVAVSPEDQLWFEDRFRCEIATGPIRVVSGGAERSDTVEAGLREVAETVELVAVHDAARPLITPDTIEAVVQAALRTGASIPATAIASTIKRVDTAMHVAETVPRNGLWAAQTPQIARRDWLVRAFAQRGNSQPTDEAQLLEQAGFPVEVVAGPPSNFKLTTQDDFDLARAYLRSRS